MFNYPNPCDSCEKEGTTSCNFRSCADYHMFMNTMWKRYRAYPLRKIHAERQKAEGRFLRYEHPDVVRQYLTHSPCEGCQFELLCDVPCGAYCCWWDARMEAMRKKYGGTQ